MKKNYEYLLQRPEHTFDYDSIYQSLEGRRVLVTGAGGSIGSAVTRILAGAPTAFVGMVGHSEYPIFTLKNALVPALALGRENKLGAAIASVADEHVMAAILDRWEIDTIIHAAAYKHVGLMEAQPEQAFANNTLATISLAKVAFASKSVRRFAFVSTDKAVVPTSVMGASKRLAEVWLKQHAMPFATICRFGNVLGSSGSLVEIIENKLASGEPITVTDTRMERYFITPREAVGLVLTAAFVEEGDCFTINMGKPVPIMDIVETMAPRHQVLITGKPGSGEKISEEVVAPGELTSRTSNPAITRISFPHNPRIDGIIASVKQHPSTLVQEARAL